MGGNPLMIIKVLGSLGRPARPRPAWLRDVPTRALLPLRSMVGQLPLEQHIGVRILAVSDKGRGAPPADPS